ncbi:unnamed protein product [Rhizophagus irregularis]|nr:unnamed protein product [Rhizophagus irregularis]
MYSKTKIFIETIGLENSIIKIKFLNPDERLSNIRKELEHANIINNMLVFSKEINNEFFEVEREDEEKFQLKEIIMTVKTAKKLYLKRLTWNFFNKQYKLDYGCTIGFGEIRRANKRAFEMNDSILTETNSKGIKKGQLKFESKEDWMKKTNLFFKDYSNINDFINLGLSVESSLNTNFDRETYQYIEISKLKLTFSKNNLTLTDDFKNVIIEAIKSKDPKNFREIIMEYGQFIPTNVILGGRVYFKGTIMSSMSPENSSDSIDSMEIEIESDPDSSKKKTNFNSMRLLGGKHPKDKKFNEEAWIKSLNSYHTWECIEYRKPNNIFQLLPDDLRKESYKSIGKKVLYTNIIDYNYRLYEPGMYGTFELTDAIPRNILEIIQDEETDCDIFAAVVNVDKNSKDVFFNCQIFKEKNARPSIIIHGIQKKFRQRTYNLKIALMIVGYDTKFNFILSDIANVELIKINYESKFEREFDNIKLQRKLGSIIASGIPFFGIPVLSNFDSSNNSIIIGHNFSSNQSIDIFSYNAKINRYTKLPDFTLYLLILSDYSNLNNYVSIPFNYKILKSPFIPLQSSQSIIPKYISLYLSKKDNDNYKPIFLKQDNEQIKVKYVHCRCNRTCFICQNKTTKISKSERNINCILFDPLLR